MRYLNVDSPSEKSTLQVEPLTLTGVVFVILEAVLLLLLGVWATAGPQEAASVLRGDSSTAAFQISSCAWRMLPHWNMKIAFSSITGKKSHPIIADAKLPTFLCLCIKNALLFHRWKLLPALLIMWIQLKHTQLCTVIIRSVIFTYYKWNKNEVWEKCLKKYEFQLRKRVKRSIKIPETVFL